MKSFLTALSLLSVLLSLPAAGQVNSVSVRSRLDPNAVLITEIDIIFVYDADIANNFPASKSSWYSGKRAFTREVGDAVDVVNIFIPQGFDSVTAALPARKYCQTFGPGFISSRILGFADEPKNHSILRCFFTAVCV